MIVKSVLEEMGTKFEDLELGQVDLAEDMGPAALKEFDEKLRRYGLELLDDKRAILIERIKHVIIEMVHYSEDFPAVKYSVHISEKLGQDYASLSSLFSEVSGTTIQEFFIRHKIEKAKELILYDRHSLSDIADMLHYSSTAHFSNQFKKVTGLTPSYFRKMKKLRTRNLEDI
jgi:AraC-like DNA-binding protein